MEEDIFSENFTAVLADGQTAVATASSLYIRLLKSGIAHFFTLFFARSQALNMPKVVILCAFSLAMNCSQFTIFVGCLFKGHTVGYLEVFFSYSTLDPTFKKI